MAIADHIWDAFEEMAQQMGADRDGLVNQAMFMFARLNGFMMGNAAAAVSNGAAKANGAAAANGAAMAAAPAAAPARGAAPAAGPGAKAAAAASARPPARPPEPAEDPARREVAERVLETAAELERLIKGKNNAPEEEPEEEMADEPPPEEDVEGVDNMDVAEEEEAPPEEEAPADDEESGNLYLMTDSGDMDKIVKDRFVIGRGKHCDFVINSGKVSREHAVIVREGTDFFIEDLGSSNGTWFNKQRIKRRKIEDGDEYFICSEKIKLVTR